MYYFQPQTEHQDVRGSILCIEVRAYLLREYNVLTSNSIGGQLVYWHPLVFAFGKYVLL